jgi:hypothetical protein
MNIVYINGIPEEFKEDLNAYADRNISRDPSEGPAIIWGSGKKEWLVNGRHHRKDGPAVEWASGDKSWYMHGQLHREDGPALEWADGSKFWYLNGNPHRTDGPAVIRADSEYIEWCYNGEKYSFEDFIKAAGLSEEQAVLLALEWK